MTLIGHLDLRAGIAGDMWLGALVAAGAPLDALRTAVSSLGVEPIELTSRTVSRGGLSATKVDVMVAPDPAPRRWTETRALVVAAPLDADVKDRSIRVLTRIAEAEAAIHGVPVDEVHLHELGALDTLADVVGTCAGVAALGLSRITCGTVAVGSGTVDGAHGQLPIPAPATVALLRGFVVAAGDVAAELTTPTGAALLAEFATPVATMPPMRLHGEGRGAGDRELPVPNIARLIVGEAIQDAAATSDTLVLEATVDDLSPQLIPVVLDRLRAVGAHDAWVTPVLMKKGRPGFTLSALVAASNLDDARDVLYRETSTIGCRWYAVGKDALERTWAKVEVGGHDVRVKVARLRGEVVNAAPEFDDARAVADETGRAVKDVLDEAAARARALPD